MIFRSLICCSLLLPTLMVDERLNREPTDDCGVNCLFVGLTVLNGNADLSLTDLSNRLSPKGEGNSIAQLSSTANDLGFQTMAVSTTLESLQIRERPFVFIAHMKQDHYVLISDATDTAVQMVNPPQTNTVPAASFVDAWDGTGLLISSEKLEPEESLVSRLWWSAFRRNALYAVAIAGALAVLVFLARAILIRRRAA